VSGVGSRTRASPPGPTSRGRSRTWGSGSRRFRSPTARSSSRQRSSPWPSRCRWRGARCSPPWATTPWRGPPSKASRSSSPSRTGRSSTSSGGCSPVVSPCPPAILGGPRPRPRRSWNTCGRVGSGSSWRRLSPPSHAPGSHRAGSPRRIMRSMRPSKRPTSWANAGSCGRRSRPGRGSSSSGAGRMRRPSVANGPARSWTTSRRAWTRSSGSGSSRGRGRAAPGRGRAAPVMARRFLRRARS